MVESDVEEAKWYALAPDQGCANAQFNLGMMYEFGRGVSECPTQAAKWFQTAADEGVAESHLNGRGVALSNVEAAKWYTKAAGKVHADAIVYL